MTKASNNADAPDDQGACSTPSSSPLAKTYTAGGLDDKTRNDLMKFLAETHDPRTQPALAKALKDFETGKTDDETRVACESINAMAKAGVKLDQTRHRRAVERASRKFQLSQDEQPAPLPGHARRHRRGEGPQLRRQGHRQAQGPGAARTRASTSRRTSSCGGSSPPCRSSASCSTRRRSSRSSSRCSRRRRPRRSARPSSSRCSRWRRPPSRSSSRRSTGATPTTQRPRLATTRANVGVIADVLAIIGRPGGRDAILAALPSADTDTARTELAQALTQMPPRPALRAGVPRRVQEGARGTTPTRCSNGAEPAHRPGPGVGEVLRPEARRLAPQGDEGRPRLRRRAPCSSRPRPS